MIRRALTRSLQTAAAHAPAESEALSRAWLYIPSNVERMLAKSLTTRADRVIFDLEDSVSDEQKDDARKMLFDFLKGTGSSLDKNRVAVRVNALQTPFFEQDLRDVLALPNVDTLVLPKVNGAHELTAIERIVGSRGRPVNIVASIESARAIVGLRDIAAWKSQIPGSGLSMSGLLFAAEDYCADTRVQRTETGEELVYPRTSVAIAARAFGLLSIDMVCIDYKNEETLVQECQSARRLGFDGKQAIHPVQVPIIHKELSPTDQEIVRAVKIIRGMKRAKAKSRGSFALKIDGRTQMVDAPMIKQAHNTLRIADAAQIKSIMEAMIGDKEKD